MSLEQIGLAVMVLFIVIAVVAAIADGEKPKKKDNIRVPRETLWARTNRYHRGY
jgi:hypothetical protein